MVERSGSVTQRPTVERSALVGLAACLVLVTLWGCEETALEPEPAKPSGGLPDAAATTETGGRGGSMVFENAGGTSELPGLGGSGGVYEGTEPCAQTSAFA